MEAPTPTGCNPVEAQVPEAAQQKIAKWIRMYHLEEPSTKTCSADMSYDNVIWFYFLRDREWSREGFDAIRVGERFDGFVSGRRFTYVVPVKRDPAEGTLIVTATTVQSRFEHAREALHWCDRSVYGERSVTSQVAER